MATYPGPWCWWCLLPPRSCWRPCRCRCPRQRTGPRQCPASPRQTRGQFWCEILRITRTSYTSYNAWKIEQLNALKFFSIEDTSMKSGFIIWVLLYIWFLLSVLTTTFDIYVCICIHDTQDLFNFVQNSLIYSWIFRIMDQTGSDSILDLEPKNGIITNKNMIFNMSNLQQILVINYVNFYS